MMIYIYRFLKKIPHPFMIIKRKILGIEEKCLKIIKAIFDKPIHNITLSGERLKAFHLRSERQ